MSSRLTRAGKGSALTHNEMDTNLKKGAQTKAGAYTVAESDNWDTIEYSGTGGDDFTMPDVATVVAAADTGDFEVTIKHVGTGVLGITNTTGADTIDGSTSDIALQTNDSVTLKTNQAGDGYLLIVGSFRRATGSFTSASIAGGGTWAGAAETITHGLGSDDIDFGCTVVGSGSGIVPFAVAAMIMGVDKRSVYVSGIPTAADDTPTITAPSTGDIDIWARNEHATTAQTVTVNWWAQTR